ATNALTTDLLSALAATLDCLATNPSCHAVMICGADGNFAAGADINEIAAKTRDQAIHDPRNAAWSSIRAFPKPLIAAVDGFALGGGLELALMADLMVVGGTARLGLPESNLGLIPGAGGGQRLLARIGPARAARMVLTGEIIDAAQAEAWGLCAWRVAGSAVDEAEVLAARIAARAPLAMNAAKRALVNGAEARLAFKDERAGFEALLDSADKTEGIRAFRERRKPEFRGQ
ncbi:MAG: enoyl-CoA hydratase-related protein, partial [Pseudomonadota bacterium]